MVPHNEYGYCTTKVCFSYGKQKLENLHRSGKKFEVAI